MEEEEQEKNKTDSSLLRPVDRRAIIIGVLSTVISAVVLYGGARFIEWISDIGLIWAAVGLLILCTLALTLLMPLALRARNELEAERMAWMEETDARLAALEKHAREENPPASPEANHQ